MRNRSLSWFQVFRVWLSMEIQAFAATIVASILIGGAIWLVSKALGHAVVPDLGDGLLGFGIYLAGSLWGMRMALEKEYREFRLTPVDTTRRQDQEA
jgi:hypothetical protein